MAESSPLKATPKRKRDDVITEQRIFNNSSPSNYGLPRTNFSFQAPILRPVENPRNEAHEDGNSSPRSKVAQKFQELALESGGGVNHNKDRADGTVVLGTENDEASPESPRFSPELPVFDFDGGNSSSSSSSADDMQLDEDDGVSRKRVKLPDLPDCREIGEIGLNGQPDSTRAIPFQPNGSVHFALQSAVDPAIVRTTKNGNFGRLQKSYPSINRLSDSKSRSRKRAGTPPLAKRNNKSTEPTPDEEPIVIDPIRAALTWHEDEITVYDPEDKDDDGTGINGIGFRPTPAIAYARAQKRRQQLAEYKKREESEARAKRSQRRRQQFGNAGGLERKHSIVRVHFSEAEPTTVVTN
ncbi:uncharacterized protein F4822DRAFT_345922 [Hypoxylon trugodes]|uniref:uncharacterized protein n=1 Tax=Hypoxylon trugodes TaxID=326681 RepID=UPI002192CC3E|nr:uncharacterized protein F4822DRAFT_345922 [Hypoxylon trugodes]KAI1385507.1 hypothetical protein F4822DRAFT_345922 [Hypoxylon trugodes]